MLQLGLMIIIITFIYAQCRPLRKNQLLKMYLKTSDNYVKDKKN